MNRCIDEFKSIIQRNKECDLSDNLDTYEEWDIWGKQAFTIYIKKNGKSYSLEQISKIKTLKEAIEIMKKL